MSLLLTRKQKEKLVIKLAKEGKTTREIAKELHISPKDIGKICRKVTGDEDPQIESEKLERHRNLSDCAKAFRMFMEHKNLPEVIVSLNIDVQTGEAYQYDYLRLMNMNKLVDIYNEIGPDFPIFLQLYNQIKEKGLDKQEIARLIQNQLTIIDMEKAIALLQSDIYYLKKDKEELYEHIKNSLEDMERIAS